MPDDSEHIDGAAKKKGGKPPLPEELQKLYGVPEDFPEDLKPRWHWATLAFLAYAAAVLLADALAAQGVQWPVDWTVFRWRLNDLGPWLAQQNAPPWLMEVMRWPASSYFDTFKFTLWFLVPLGVCLWTLDWAQFWYNRWRRVDFQLLFILAGGGALAMMIIPQVESLRAYYPSQSHMDIDDRMRIVLVQMAWVISWLPGWEFLHRYFLLRRLDWQFPRWGWLLVPVFEVVYHLQKAWLEVLGMAVFSLILTYWAKRRQNVLLPFLAHLIIEIELILFLAFV